MEAKRCICKLIRLPEPKSEDVSIYTRNRGSVVRITLVDDTPVSGRIGIARGIFRAPEDFDANNDEATAMLMEGTL